MKCEEFIGEFDVKVDFVTRIDEHCFFVPKELEEHMNASCKSAGIHLGIEKKEFEPVPSICEVLKESTKRIQIDDKAAWLFLCGRDLLRSAILKGVEQEGLVLVENVQQEILGIGKVMQPMGRAKLDKIVVKNVLNKSWYLGK